MRHKSTIIGFFMLLTFVLQFIINGWCLQIFYIAIFLRNPSWEPIFFLLIVQLVTLPTSCYALWYALDLKTAKHLRRFTHTFKDMNYKEYSFYKLVEIGLVPKTSTDDAYSEKKPDLHTTRSFNQNVAFYHYAASSKNALGPVTFQWVSYRFLTRHSYIFVSDAPEELNDRNSAVARYKILHELGHVSADNVQIIGTMRGFQLNSCFFPLLCVINLDINLISLLFIIIYIILTIVSLYFWEHQTVNSKLLEEINADQFAISHLSQNNKLRLSTILRQTRIPDSSLSEKQNNYRHSQLLEKLLSSSHKLSTENNAVWTGFSLNALVILLLSLMSVKPLESYLLTWHVILLVVVPIVIAAIYGKALDNIMESVKGFLHAKNWESSRNTS